MFCVKLADTYVDSVFEGMNNCIAVYVNCCGFVTIAHILRVFKMEKTAKTINIKYWCIILVCCGKMCCCFSKRF